MARGGAAASLPQWIKPQLALLADRAPTGAGWLHEIKLDGYRMHARLDGGRAQLLTRTGLDWTERYPTIAAELAGLPGSAYLDGEICAMRPDGVTSFALLQAANVAGDGLVFFAFDLLYLGGAPLDQLPLRERKAQLAALIGAGAGWLRYVDHHEGDGPAIHQAACRLVVEGIVSKPPTHPICPAIGGLG